MSARVLLCGAWDEGPGYPRTTSLRLGLEAAGAEVATCRVEGLGRAKQRLLRAPWRWPGHVLRQRRMRNTLLADLERCVREQRPDVVVVPYPGHAIAPAIRERVDVPVVLDLFLSAYDTVVEDRRIVRPGSLIAHWLCRLDTRACHAADVVLVDTPENALYTQALTGLPAERFAWLPVHDPDAPATPAPWTAPADGTVRLLFFGTGVPLHGLTTLVDAVASVPAVHLTLIGGTAGERAHATGLLGSRLTLLPAFVARDALQRELAASHLVAGVFGAPGSGKVQRVVPFKLVHALAAGRPVITADTPAVRRWLDGSGAVFVAAAGDALELTERLRELVAAPDRLGAAAAAARPAYDRHFGTKRLASRCRELLQRLCGAGASEAA